MTRANVSINGTSFFLKSDGHDKEELKSLIEGYILDAKEKLKHLKDVGEFVVNAITKDGENYLSWIQNGGTDYASCEYVVNIDEQGNLSFEMTKGE